MHLFGYTIIVTISVYAAWLVLLNTRCLLRDWPRAGKALRTPAR